MIDWGDDIWSHEHLEPDLLQTSVFLRQQSLIGPSFSGPETALSGRSGGLLEAVQVRNQPPDAA
jgi:hypothetical protein